METLRKSLQNKEGFLKRVQNGKKKLVFVPK